MASWRTFPFTLPAPPGPLTYSGKTFSLAWRIEARLCAFDRLASGPPSRLHRSSDILRLARRHAALDSFPDVFERNQPFGI